MPNTLAHLGIQRLALGGVLRDADPRWIYLGCVIPDLPWIGQRALQILPFVDPVQLRLYAIAQASLALCLLACIALSVLTAAPLRIATVLASSAGLHLLLDALETKWANGVHLAAPVSWKLWNAGWAWPESPWVDGLTLLGLGLASWTLWRGCDRPPAEWRTRGALRRSVAIGCGLLYLVLPCAFRPAVKKSDSHYVRTLLERELRAGRPVEVDRAPYLAGPPPRLRVLTGEELVLSRSLGAEDALVSVRGRFLDETTLDVEEYHRHRSSFRSLASYVGLALVAAIWLRSFSTGASGSSPARRGAPAPAAARPAPPARSRSGGGRDR